MGSLRHVCLWGGSTVRSSSGMPTDRVVGADFVALQWADAPRSLGRNARHSGRVLPGDGQRAPADDKSPPRPNVLLILADDQRWDTIGAAGQSRNQDTKRRSARGPGCSFHERLLDGRNDLGRLPAEPHHADHRSLVVANSDDTRQPGSAGARPAPADFAP